MSGDAAVTDSAAMRASRITAPIAAVLRVVRVVRIVRVVLLPAVFESNSSLSLSDSAVSFRQEDWKTLPVMAGAEHWEAEDGTPRGLGSASVVVLIMAVLGKDDGRASLLHSPIEV